ncbi:MAG TPA: FAD-dependent oxidoreductase, partial [Aeromicrobium sp.]|nr:FAD-dependent oxidoreductase [Aeromicrobium sp.]
MAQVVVIGADAAGATVAANVRRRLPEGHQVVVLERGQWTSYSACGIPYWVSGEIRSADQLIARTPEEHRRNGIDLRIGVEATAIDRDRKVVVTDHGDVPYDKLVIATGAEPVRPDLPGIRADGILGVQSIDDGQRVLEAIGTDPRHVVVVGSGYIGMEMAEACVARGLDTTVVERSATPLRVVEPQIGD